MPRHKDLDCRYSDDELFVVLLDIRSKSAWWQFGVIHHEALIGRIILLS